jgi:hypothetical protein
MECQYCKKVLSNKYSLAVHIKSSKKCFKSRGTKFTSSFTCKSCNNIFCSKVALNRHIIVCKVKKDKDTEDKLHILQKKYDIEIIELNNKIEEQDIELEHKDLELNDRNEQIKQREDYYKQLSSEYREKIAALEAKIELYEKRDISTTNNTTNNTINNNVTNVNNIIVSSLDIMENPNMINKLIQEHYSTDYFIEGQIGVAKFSNDHLVTDEKGNKLYICTDTSRNSFKYKNSKGEIVKDQHGTKFASNLLDNGLKDMARKHSNALLNLDHDFTNVTSKFFEIDDMCKDTKKFCKHLGSLVSI